MRGGAREGFPYRSVKLVLLANGNRYEMDSNTFSQNGKALYPFRIMPYPNCDLFLTHIRTCSLWVDDTNVLEGNLVIFVTSFFFNHFCPIAMYDLMVVWLGWPIRFRFKLNLVKGGFYNLLSSLSRFLSQVHQSRVDEGLAASARNATLGEPSWQWHPWQCPSLWKIGEQS
jgi:hypothetical protein